MPPSAGYAIATLILLFLVWLAFQRVNRLMGNIEQLLTILEDHRDEIEIAKDRIETQTKALNLLLTDKMGGVEEAAKHWEKVKSDWERKRAERV